MMSKYWLPQVNLSIPSSLLEASRPRDSEAQKGWRSSVRRRGLMLCFAQVKYCQNVFSSQLLGPASTFFLIITTVELWAEWLLTTERDDRHSKNEEVIATRWLTRDPKSKTNTAGTQTSVCVYSAESWYCDSFATEHCDQWLSTEKIHWQQSSNISTGW